MEGADEWRVLGEMLGFRGLEGRWAIGVAIIGPAMIGPQDRPAAQDVLVAGLAVQVRRAVRVGLVVQARLAVQAQACSSG